MPAKFKPTNVLLSTNNIKPTEVRDTEKVSFNFKRLNEKENKFKFTCKDAKYFCILLDRLKNISYFSKKELATNNSRGLRCHKINFSDIKVSERSFGILGEDVDEDAWQFELTANEHGRVHGYFIDSIFYVVWLDPDHELYPQK